MVMVDYADYEWASQQDLSRYAGKWVAIANKKIVAVSDKVGEVREKAKKASPSALPFLKKIPKQALSIL